MFRRLSENVLLILKRGVLVPCGQEFSGLVIETSNFSGGRRAIDVDIPNRQKNANTLTWTPVICFVFDDNYSAISGGDDEARFTGNYSIRVAKETENKES